MNPGSQGEAGRGKRLAEAIRTARDIAAHVSSVLEGKDDVVELALVALLARGHLLIEDVPGVGKTTLAQALASSVDATFGRIQFTSDLMPADVLGGSVLDPKGGEFRFRPGPIFHQIVLADEVNRTTPKTQSALLEAMAEKQVSIDGVSRPLDDPFFVVATQNPLDFHGTYPLPESQLDRFLICTTIGYPDLETERKLLRDPKRQSERPRPPAASRQELIDAQRAIDEVHVDESVHDYLLTLIARTRSHDAFQRGASTRAVLAFDQAVRACAVIRGRHFALVDDVKHLAPAVLAHRVRANQEGQFVSRQDTERLVRLVLDEIPVPV